MSLFYPALILLSDTKQLSIILTLNSNVAVILEKVL